MHKIHYDVNYIRSKFSHFYSVCFEKQVRNFNVCEKILREWKRRWGNLQSSASLVNRVVKASHKREMLGVSPRDFMELSQIKVGYGMTCSETACKSIFNLWFYHGEKLFPLRRLQVLSCCFYRSLPSPRITVMLVNYARVNGSISDTRERIEPADRLFNHFSLPRRLTGKLFCCQTFNQRFARFCCLLKVIKQLGEAGG